LAQNIRYIGIPINRHSSEHMVALPRIQMSYLALCNTVTPQRIRNVYLFHGSAAPHLIATERVHLLHKNAVFLYRKIL